MVRNMYFVAFVSYRAPLSCVNDRTGQALFLSVTVMCSYLVRQVQ